jgi:transcriptional regulator NrdR family protein
METPQNDIPEESVDAEVVEGPPPETRAASYVQAPKLMRIASMPRAMLDEVRQAPLDDPGRRRLADVYDRSLTEMQDVLSDDLRQELADIFTPISSEAVENLVSGIEDQLVNSGRMEIKSRDIGHLAMEKLRELDKVAYIRFASVYLPLGDVESIRKELEGLLQSQEDGMPATGS